MCWLAGKRGSFTWELTSEAVSLVTEGGMSLMRRARQRLPGPLNYWGAPQSQACRAWLFTIDSHMNVQTIMTPSFVG